MVYSAEYYGWSSLHVINLLSKDKKEFCGFLLAKVIFSLLHSDLQHCMSEGLPTFLCTIYRLLVLMLIGQVVVGANGVS